MRKGSYGIQRFKVFHFIEDAGQGDEKKRKQCVKLWQRINTDQAASVCPIDPNKGRCGVPNHVDLYGEGIKNAMEVPLFHKVKPEDVKEIKIHVEEGFEGFATLKNWMTCIEKCRVRQRNQNTVGRCHS